MLLALASALAAPACLDATPGECVEYRSFPGPYADAAAAQANLQALIAADPLKAVQAAGMMHLWFLGPTAASRAAEWARVRAAGEAEAVRAACTDPEALAAVAAIR